MSRFVAAILLSAIAVDRFVLVEARTHLTASRLLFPNELVPSSENRVVPSGPLVDHYEGDDDIVCTVSEHGALSPGRQRHTFKRAALDLRRPARRGPPPDDGVENPVCVPLRGARPRPRAWPRAALVSSAAARPPPPRLRRRDSCRDAGRPTVPSMISASRV